MATPSTHSVVSDIGQSVLTELQCPACNEYMAPPILFCLGGHNICSSCRPVVSSCPTCKQWFLKARNVSLENLSLQMKFPCSNSKYGCKDAVPHSKISEHKSKCGYSPQTCPVDYLRLKMICTWTGIAKDLKQHLQTAHKELCEDYDAHHLLTVPSSGASKYSFKFLFAYNEIFCFRLLIQSGILYLVLHYIGAAENDKKYQYKVMVMNKDDTEGLVVTYLARNVIEFEEESFFPRKCLKLHNDLTDQFRNEKDELQVLLKILRMDQ